MSKSYRGDAIVTTVTTDIASGDLTIPIGASTGWPSGAGGKPFVAEINDGTNVEKILCATRTGLTLAVSSRGYDDTVAAAFLTGATIKHVFDAKSAQDASDHIDDPDPAGHTSLLNASRHDLPARHVFGGALLAASVSAPVQATQSRGSGNTVAAGNHVHALDASIAGSGLVVVAGILNVLFDDVTLTVTGDTLQVKAGGIANSHLGSQVVQSGNIAPDAIVAGLIAAGAVEANDLASGAINLASQIVDGIITRAKLATDARKSIDVAWGLIDSKASTADQTGVTNATVTGLSSTFTAIANRAYRYSVNIPLLQLKNAGDVATSAQVEAFLCDGSNVALSGVAGSHVYTKMSTNDVGHFTIVCIETGVAAGSTTRRVRTTLGTASVGTPSLSIFGLTNPGNLLIEDAGPA